MQDSSPKSVRIVPIEPPPGASRVARQAIFAARGEKKTRYHLPDSLDSPSPVGYRTRVSLTADEAQQAAALLSLERPDAFVSGEAVREQALFEECALGVLTSRQSTNYRGFRQCSLGPKQAAELAEILREMDPLEAPVLSGASHAHVVFYRPYRTPFTLLLTFVGHKPVASLMTVPWRGFKKRYAHASDIPTVGYLPQLHIGILADAMERAAALASYGTRRANIFQEPFVSGKRRVRNAAQIAALEALCGISDADRGAGWRIAFVAQVGEVAKPLDFSPGLVRKLGATLMAFRSERIQPGVNQAPQAPAAYQDRQGMRVPDELTVQAGRALYNAFSHWTGCDRERAKSLVMLERIDVLTPGGKQRLRAVRAQLAGITDRVVKELPLWADLPTGKLLSRSAGKGRKAFALAGQRIYVGGLSRSEIEAEGLNWNLALRALGAASSRSALVCELAGVVDIPEACDMLGGICLMAGPVNQNDIGKQFQGCDDLLAGAFPERAPTSLLVWTLKAKTVADPIGNEEQLLNPRRQGALVELRPGPHEVVRVVGGPIAGPLRFRSGRVNAERAFGDVGNFVVDPEGRAIPGNAGSSWPRTWATSAVWE